MGYVQGAVALLRPCSNLAAHAPADRPAPCKSRGCKHLANCNLCYGGLYCCLECQTTPGKHGDACQGFPADPGRRPARCASPGCKYFAHTDRRNNGGAYCCRKCRDNGANVHGLACQLICFDTSGEPEWMRAQHGNCSIDISAKMVLGFPRWLVPLSLIQWVFPTLLKLAYPLFARLCRFDDTPFHERVREDRTCFYAAIRPRLKVVEDRLHDAP